MTTPESGDTQSPRKAVPKLVFNRTAYDPIAKAKGYPTVQEQAQWHKIHRATMSTIRAGTKVPRLDTAMRIATNCGVTIEDLWDLPAPEPVAA